VNYKDAKTLATIIKHSFLYVTEGKGHRRILRDKEVIEKVSNFVSKPYAALKENIAF
jgi:hypothetical protein